MGLLQSYFSQTEPKEIEDTFTVEDAKLFSIFDETKPLTSEYWAVTIIVNIDENGNNPKFGHATLFLEGATNFSEQPDGHLRRILIATDFYNDRDSKLAFLNVIGRGKVKTKGKDEKFGNHMKRQIQTEKYKAYTKSITLEQATKIKTRVQADYDNNTVAYSIMGTDSSGTSEVYNCLSYCISVIKEATGTDICKGHFWASPFMLIKIPTKFIKELNSIK